MATPQRSASQGTFFLTTVCYNRRRIFQVTRNAELFRETLDHYRPHYELHAYVLMPDHVHLIRTPRDKTLSQIMNLIKGGFSHKLASKLPVWQRGYTDHLIQSPADFAVRQNYIHQNPVAERLVETAELYPYSSASPGIRMDLYPG
ncbi:MAG: transposase [Acidobacteriaceae bacterium]|nr:transposase [Acidobacteriaceae bacterium]